MDVERLQELAKQYPEIGELLKNNYSLSVALLYQKIHALDQRITNIETVVEKIRVGCRDLLRRLEALEAKNREGST